MLCLPNCMLLRRSLILESEMLSRGESQCALQLQAVAPLLKGPSLLANNAKAVVV